MSEHKAASDSERRLLELCRKDLETFSKEACHEELELLLRQPELQVDATDESGMTALIHAAYHGNTNVCRLLLDSKADPNSNHHTDGYSALMFATIAGHPEVVEVLLKGGARTSTVNKIGKTATEMGSFVGQHSCVRVINNFFSVADMEYYTRPQGVEKVPKLDPSCAPLLQKLVTLTTVHPVKLILFLEGHPLLLEHHSEVCRVMGLMMEKKMKEESESLTLKLHYLSFIVRNHLEGREALMKMLLTQQDDGAIVELDKFLRQCLREFPFTHSTLLKQMVATLAKIPPGGSPSALALFHNAILGRKSEEEEEESCSTCGECQKTLKKCSKCKQVHYCSVECQKLAWTVGNHRKLCKKWCQQQSSPQGGQAD